MSSVKNLYRYHVANVRAISVGLDRIERALRREVAAGNQQAIDIDIRMYALLLGVWGEARLNKLLHEPAFSDDDRQFFRQIDTHLERWKCLVETAFRKRYNVPKAKLSATTLPHSAYSRYVSLIELLDSELSPIITLRNKLAHGQWIYPMTADGSNIAQAQFDALRNENALSLQLKRKLILSLLEIIHFLCVSAHTFQRDFDNEFNKIEQLRQQLRNKPYARYASMMAERLARGMGRRTNPKASHP